METLAAVAVARSTEAETATATATAASYSSPQVVTNEVEEAGVPRERQAPGRKPIYISISSGNSSDSSACSNTDSPKIKKPSRAAPPKKSMMASMQRRQFPEREQQQEQQQQEPPEQQGRTKPSKPQPPIMIPVKAPSPPNPKPPVPSKQAGNSSGGSAGTGKQPKQQPQQSQQYTPMGHRIVRQPNDHDILLGRGGAVNGHPGNIRFREWVRARKHDYSLAKSKAEKNKLAKEIMQCVKDLRPPGRFLMRDNTSIDHPGGVQERDIDSANGAYWFEITDERRIMQKTSQALREGAPAIRKTDGTGCGGGGSVGETPSQASASGTHPRPPDGKEKRGGAGDNGQYMKRNHSHEDDGSSHNTSIVTASPERPSKRIHIDCGAAAAGNSLTGAGAPASAALRHQLQQQQQPPPSLLGNMMHHRNAAAGGGGAANLGGAHHDAVASSSMFSSHLHPHHPASHHPSAAMMHTLGPMGSHHHQQHGGAGTRSPLVSHHHPPGGGAAAAFMQNRPQQHMNRVGAMHSPYSSGMSPMLMQQQLQQHHLHANPHYNDYPYPHLGATAAAAAAGGGANLSPPGRFGGGARAAASAAAAARGLHPTLHSVPPAGAAAAAIEQEAAIHESLLSLKKQPVVHVKAAVEGSSNPADISNNTSESSKLDNTHPDTDPIQKMILELHSGILANAAAIEELRAPLVVATKKERSGSFGSNGSCGGGNGNGTSSSTPPKKRKFEVTDEDGNSIPKSDHDSKTDCTTAPDATTTNLWNLNRQLCEQLNKQNEIILQLVQHKLEQQLPYHAYQLSPPAIEPSAYGATTLAATTPDAVGVASATTTAAAHVLPPASSSSESEQEEAE